MWFAANAATHINSAKGFGFDVEVKNFSWKKLKQGRDNYIKGITTWYDGYLEDLGIDYIHGFGKLVDKNTVSVNGETYTVKIGDTKTATGTIIDLEVPTSLPNVDSKILDPRDTYSEVSVWDEKANHLAELFITNFERYTDKQEGKDLVAAGPKL